MAQRTPLTRFLRVTTTLALVAVVSGCGGAASKIAEIQARIEAARLQQVTPQSTTVPAQTLASLNAGTVRSVRGAASGVRFTYDANQFANNTRVNPTSNVATGASKMQQVKTTAVADTYEFIFNGGVGEVTVDLSQANEQVVNSNRNVPITFRPVSGLVLDYTEAGVWATDRGTTTQSSMGGFFFGNESRTSDLPQVPGNLVYNGQLVGEFRSGAVNSAVSGNVALTADFTTNTVGGGITGITLDDLAGAPAFNDLTISGTMANGRLANGSTVTAGAVPVVALNTNNHLTAGASGPLNGRFYGPNAEEFGGALRVVEVRTNLQNRGLTGAIGAKR